MSRPGPRDGRGDCVRHNYSHLRVGRVDRRSLIVLGLAALAVVAIGLSAATLTSTVSPSGGQGSETANETGGAGTTQPELNGSSETDPGSGALPLAQRLMMVLGGLMLLGALGYAVLNPSRATGLAVILLCFLLVVSLLIVVTGDTETNPGQPPEQQPQEDQQKGSSNPGSGGDSEVLYDIPVVWWFLGSFAVVILGLILVLRRYGLRSDEESEDGDGDESESDEETAALGAIAGQAADRIENGSADGGSGADNEVYRAWAEMTAQLDIETGETTTPREFERQAAAAGMAPDHVRELTALFETVRYGGESVTEDREQRAVSVLRRIESTYGGEQ